MTDDRQHRTELARAVLDDFRLVVQGPSVRGRNFEVCRSKLEALCQEGVDFALQDEWGLNLMERVLDLAEASASETDIADLMWVLMEHGDNPWNMAPKTLGELLGQLFMRNLLDMCVRQELKGHAMRAPDGSNGLHLMALQAPGLLQQEIDALDKTYGVQDDAWEIVRRWAGEARLGGDTPLHVFWGDPALQLEIANFQKIGAPSTIYRFNVEAIELTHTFMDLGADLLHKNQEGLDLEALMVERLFRTGFLPPDDEEELKDLRPIIAEIERLKLERDTPTSHINTKRADRL